MIRRAVPEEAAMLSRLALRSKAHWGYDEPFMAACREELTLSADEIEQTPIYVCEHGGEVAGFYGLERLDAARMELNYLFVQPALIGHGHGRALIEHAKATSRALGASVLLVQGDPHAERFYRAAGARRIGERASQSVPGRMLPWFEIAL